MLPECHFDLVFKKRILCSTIMRIRLRRICSVLIFIFLPAQLMVMIGVHYLHRKDDKIPQDAANKATALRVSAEGTPVSDHEAMEVFTELKRKWDTREDIEHVKESKDVKKNHEALENKKSGSMRQHERKLTHVLREGPRKKDNHTVHLPRLIKSQTPILINQTKAAIDQLKKSRDRLFSDAIGPLSDSQCTIPTMDTPIHTCREYVQWKCKMVPTFTTYDPVNRVISVNCKGMFRVNQVERLQSEYPVSPDNYRQPPFWEYYEGIHNITMETEYADVACKDKLFQDVHNYHTTFLPKPGIDWLQGNALRTIRLKEPQWKPVSILTIVLDSTSRAHFHRRCGLPKTAALLRKYYDGMSSGLSHQSFMFNRLNGISSATVLNLTPLFSGQLYDHVDDDKIRQGIYGKHINEWIWQYAESRGYLTSYGIDNGSGMMGTRTHCKACLYRPPVLPHIEHGWKQRENERVSPSALSGLCEGNHMLHEYILNYTRDFLRHPHPAKWAALDLNAGHRREMESVNQVDDELSKVLQTLLDGDKNLVVFLLGDHGKPFQKDPSYIGSHYETLLPFMSVTMPTWMLRQRPDVFHNLAINQQRYLVHADVHLSMKSLLHFPHIEDVKGASGEKAVNIFQEAIRVDRGCENADIPIWSCVCGVMRKLPGREFSNLHREMAEAGLAHINSLHSQSQLSKGDSQSPIRRTSCMDVSFKRLLHVFINENENKPINSTARRLYHMTFQTIELDTIWDLVIDAEFHIKQVKQVSLYQRFDVCWDKRVPLSYCVCDLSKKAEDFT